MTAPIPVYRNSNIAGSRRTQGGVCCLAPTDEVRNIIIYIVLHYAAVHGVRLLVLVIMGNHIHWDLDDPDGKYPDFLRDIHSKITEVLNDYYGRTGPMWANCKPQRTRIVDDAKIEEKLLYAATNPTWHGIEFRSRLWPGFVFSPEDIGKTIIAACPSYLADNYRSFPAEVSYTVPKPSCYRHMTNSAARNHFAKLRNARELRLRVERRGAPFLGSEKALAVDPESAIDDPDGGGNKLVDGCPESVEDALAELSQFRTRYRTVRGAFLRGDRNAEWPRGTYAMRAWHRCPTCLT